MDREIGERAAFAQLDGAVLEIELVAVEATGDGAPVGVDARAVAVGVEDQTSGVDLDFLREVAQAAFERLFDFEPAGPHGCTPAAVDGEAHGELAGGFGELVEGEADELGGELALDGGVDGARLPAGELERAV